MDTTPFPEAAEGDGETAMNSDRRRGQLPEGQEIGRSAKAGIPHQEAQQRPGARQCSEQTEHNANSKGCGETLHKTRSQEEQGRAADQRGQVTIHDRGKGLGEAGINRTDQGVSTTQLILDAFENQNVGIHGHTDAEDETSNPRQGQGDWN